MTGAWALVAGRSPRAAGSRSPAHAGASECVSNARCLRIRTAGAGSTVQCSFQSGREPSAAVPFAERSPMRSKPTSATPAGTPALWDAGSQPEAPRRCWGAPPCPWKVEGRIPSREPGLRKRQPQTFESEIGSPGSRRFARRSRPDACPDALGVPNKQVFGSCVLTTDLTKGGANKPQTNSCQAGARTVLRHGEHDPHNLAEGDGPEIGDGPCPASSG